MTGTLSLSIVPLSIGVKTDTRHVRVKYTGHASEARQERESGKPASGPARRMGQVAHSSAHYRIGYFHTCPSYVSS